MNLSAPSMLFFGLSLALAILALVMVLGKVAIAGIPAFWVMGGAYAVLAVGCLFKGA